jgi:hypothetical protein
MGGVRVATHELCDYKTAVTHTTAAPAAERTLSPLPASRAHYTHALAETRCRWWLGKRARAAHVRNVAGGRASSPLLPFGK